MYGEEERHTLPVTENLHMLFDEIDSLRSLLRRFGYAPSERNVDMLLRQTGFYGYVEKATEEVRKAKALLSVLVGLER